MHDGHYFGKKPKGNISVQTQLNLITQKNQSTDLPAMGGETKYVGCVDTLIIRYNKAIVRHNQCISSFGRSQAIKESFADYRINIV